MGKWKILDETKYSRPTRVFQVMWFWFSLVHFKDHFLKYLNELNAHILGAADFYKTLYATVLLYKHYCVSFIYCNLFLGYK
jgi:hypothetical protein